MDVKPQSAASIASIVVVNIIWWMVMISAIGLGATHVDSCPVQPNIPIYLIVMGIVSIVALSVTYMRNAFEDGVIFILCSAFMTFLHIFSFAWFIAGSVWVYPVYPPNYSPGTERSCHKTTYQFAFVVITVLWVAFGLVFCCGGCFAFLTCCRTVFARRRLIPTRTSFYGATSDATAGDV